MLKGTWKRRQYEFKRLSEMNIVDGIMLRSVVLAIREFCICSSYARISLIGGFMLNGLSIPKRYTVPLLYPFW